MSKRQASAMIAAIIAALFASVAARAADMGADRKPSVQQILAATQTTGGLCVVLPATDGDFLAALSCDGRFVVRGLTPAATLDSVRNAVPTDLAGLVSAESWLPIATLPFADNLIDLLVIDRDAIQNGPADAELLRVVAPAQGAVWQRQAGKWSKLTKPMPKNYGEWTHYYCDATNNPVSKDAAVKVPTGLQWIAESPSRQGSQNQLIEGGRYLGNFKSNNGFPGFTSMRSAFNGVQLWRRNSTLRWSEYSRFGAIALADGLVYILRDVTKGPLVALDGATGKEVKVFEASFPEMKPPKGASMHWGNLVVFEDVLVLARGDKLYCFDRQTGKLGWTFDGAGKNVAYPTVDPVNKCVGVLVAANNDTFMNADRQTYFNPTEVASVKLKDGALAWRIPYPMPGAAGGMAAFLWADGAFYFHHSKGLAQGGFAIGCIDAATAKPRWLKPNVAKWAGGRNDPGVGVGSLLVYPKAVILTRSALEVLNPASGAVLGDWALGNSRCDNGRGDANGFTNFGHYFQLEGAKVTVLRNEVARNPCGGATLPAYGMHYFQPQVCGCYEAVRGLLAVSSQDVAPPLPDAERLDQGPAFNIAPALKEGVGDWPALLHDSARSAGGAALKNASPKETWRVRLETGDQSGPAADDWRSCANYNGPISAPIVAGGIVLVAAPDAHRMHAVDAATGRKRWTFTAGARLDTPPTVANGRVYAGGRDGYVYCLDLATGKLAWRFLAARNRKNIVAYDQIESAWPLHGSLVVENDIVIATAGYHPDIDGGIHCWGLDAGTGAVRWKRVVACERTPLPLDPERHDVGSKTYFNANRVLNSLPSSDGRVVILPGLTFSLSDGTGSAALGGTAQPKVAKDAMPAHGLMITNWGLCAPYLRSKDGEFQGPGSVLGRQSISIPGAEGRRIAWDQKRLLHLTLCDTSLLVLDRSAPYGSNLSDHKKAQVGRTVPNIGKALAVVKQEGSTIHDYSPYGNDGFDPVALVLAGDRAVVAWAVLGAEKNVHFRPESTLQFMDLHAGKLQYEIKVRPGVIEHGMATARGRLFMSLDDGSLVAFE